jgi:hypothetical protein
VPQSGRLVQTLGELTGSGSVTIDMTALASGTYTVRVRTSSGVELIERITVAK